MKKAITILTSLALGTLASLGAIKETKAQTAQANIINGIEYRIYEDTAIQVQEDKDQKAKLGVISDVHEFIAAAELFSEAFKEEKVDGIIMLGDYTNLIEERRVNKGKPRLLDIENAISAAAKTGLPIYVLPGNHELKTEYNKAMERLSKKYSNIFDMSKIRTFDGDDFDLVSNPYGTDFTYHPKGFKTEEAKLSEIVDYAKKLQRDDDPEILISHIPPLGEGKYDIDVTFDGKHVGSRTLDQAMRDAKIKFSLTGHIHEAGGKGVDSNGTPVKIDTFSKELRYSPGACSPWKYPPGKTITAMAGIIEIKGDQIKYNTLIIK